MKKTYRKTEEKLNSELAGLHQKAAKLKTLAAEHKRLEQALQESQEALRKIFESVTADIPAADLNETVTDSDPKNSNQHKRPPRRR